MKRKRIMVMMMMMKKKKKKKRSNVFKKTRVQCYINILFIILLSFLNMSSFTIR